MPAPPVCMQTIRPCPALPNACHAPRRHRNAPEHAQGDTKHPQGPRATWRTPGTQGRSSSVRSPGRRVYLGREAAAVDRPAHTLARTPRSTCGSLPPQCGAQRRRRGDPTLCAATATCSAYCCYAEATGV
eukprot:364814-Chlamydomonas_euryale.AAC.9